MPLATICFRNQGSFLTGKNLLVQRKQTISCKSDNPNVLKDGENGALYFILLFLTMLIE